MCVEKKNCVKKPQAVNSQKKTMHCALYKNV